MREKYFLRFYAVQKKKKPNKDFYVSGLYQNYEMIYFQKHLTCVIYDTSKRYIINAYNVDVKL